MGVGPCSAGVPPAVLRCVATAETCRRDTGATKPEHRGLRTALLNQLANPRANLWQAWLGFNLSHSLGIVLFGGGLLLLDWLHFPVFAASHLLQGVAVVVAATYLVLSLRFWFWGPALGSGLSLLCILAAVVLS